MLYITITIFIFLLFLLFLKKYKEDKTQEFIPDFKKEYEDFFILQEEFQRIFYSGDYITKTKISFFKNQIENFVSKADVLSKYSKYIYDKNILTWLQSIYKFSNYFQANIQKINENFYQKNLNVYAKLFQNLEKYPLDIMQQRAILTPEKYLLVIAWAGSGKTSTIVGKVKYLIEAKKALPSEILLISFTAASAQEMNQRIKDKLWLSLDVKTFHKLWLDIIRKKWEIKQTILDENGLSSFKTYLAQDFLPELITTSSQLFSDFFSYLLRENIFLFDFESMSDFQKYKWNEVEKNISILWEKMKSAEEVEMANFLLLHGIEYRYEQKYIIDTADSEFWQYKPDFFLPKYNIYIEHFWIDKNQRVPKFFWDSTPEWYEKANKKYNEWIAWKKELHKQHQTTLIVTYSYQFQDKVVFSYLESQLKTYWVDFEFLSHEEITQKISDKIKSETWIFNNLVLTFLSLYKSNHFSWQDLESKKELFTTEYKKKKSDIFLKIFSIILQKYQDILEQNNAIDFNDMINNATDLILSWRIKTPYKYVIIDEFQDIGVWRYKLVKSILDKNDAELFCVWDDWQSIYRFSGWDLNIFTHFDTYFENGEKVFINKTYRYPQKVNEITRDFIMKNKFQINKILESGNKTDSQDVYEIIYYCNDFEKKAILQELKTQYKNIVAIWRTRGDGNICKWIMDFKTAHASKGLEQDYVVIVNGNSGIKWFPSEIKDSFLLNMVLSQSDSFDYSEERRLFYVALTRAKQKTFILCEIWKVSSFVEEIEKMIWKSKKPQKCPKCEKWYLVSKNHYKNWAMWCSLYPECQYTILTIMPFWKYSWQNFSQLPDNYLDWGKKNMTHDNEIMDSIEYEICKRILFFDK